MAENLRFQMRWTLQERKLIREAAAIEKLRVSTWVRQMLLKEAEKVIREREKKP